MYFLFILPYMGLIAKIDKLRKLEKMIMFKMRIAVFTLLGSFRFCFVVFKKLAC